MSTAHRTAIGSIPQARVVSWSCTCGAAQVLDYGRGVDEAWALRLAHARAAAHRTLLHLPRRQP